MKLHKEAAGGGKLAMDMTPMIDVCFQLIIFFMLSLRLFTPEGDFTITMPMAAPSAALASPDQVPIMKVRLRARGDGELAAIQFGDRPLGKQYVDELLQIAATINAEIAAASDPKQRQARLDALDEKRAEICRKAFLPLRQEVRKMVGDKAGPGSAENTELELDCDYHLKYVYVMEAITAVSGYREGAEVKTMVGKIKFTPPRK